MGTPPMEPGGYIGGCTPAACVLSDGGPSTGSGRLKSRWFLVDKSGGGGLDDWEVKIADFVVLLGKAANKVPDT